MKAFAPLLSVLVLTSCAHQFHKTADTSAPMGSPDRSIAQAQSVARKFLTSALKAEDNILYKSVSEMESKILSEVKVNPTKYGLTEEASKKLRSIDDIKNERVMAEVLSEAPALLKFAPKMRSASMKAVMGEVGIASQIQIKAIKASAVILTAKEQTGLGRDLSLRIRNLKTSLVERNLASEAQAGKIYENLFQAAKDLHTKAKGDPAQMLLARQIVDYSTTISEKTGKNFLGKGGCLKISGKEILENKADIAYRTMKDVDSRKLASYEEIGEALQKNHAEVTNRSTKEACLAIQALTVGRSCGGVFHPSLAPKDC